MKQMPVELEKVFSEEINQLKKAVIGRQNKQKEKRVMKQNFENRMMEQHENVLENFLSHQLM